MFEEAVNQYMSDEYNPCKIESFIDAIQCINDEDSQKFQELMENRDFEKLGRFLWNLSYEKNEEWAEDRAAYDFGKFPYEER